VDQGRTRPRGPSHGASARLPAARREPEPIRNHLDGAGRRRPVRSVRARLEQRLVPAGVEVRAPGECERAVSSETSRSNSPGRRSPPTSPPHTTPSTTAMAPPSLAPWRRLKRAIDAATPAAIGPQVPGPPEHTRPSSSSMCRVPRTGVLVAAQDHPLAQRATVSIDALMHGSRPLLWMGWWPTPPPRLAAVRDGASQVVDVPFATANTARTGRRGCGLLPWLVVADLVAEGRLRTLDVRGLPPLERRSALVRVDLGPPPGSEITALCERDPRPGDLPGSHRRVAGNAVVVGNGKRPIDNADQGTLE